MGSDFLFAMPSFLSGIARTLDLGGVFDTYNVSFTEREADLRALYADWHSVGDSLVGAVEAFGEENPEAAQRALDLVEG